MPKRFRSCSLNQPYLLPPSLAEWLPEQHLARFIGEVCEQLDLSAIYAAYERRDGRGMAAYHPLMLTRLLLYAYCVGKPSSRQIEKATFDELSFRYLSADQHPDHDTILAFRQEHLEALDGLFLQALRMCREAGLVKLGHVALDGTKMRAQASQSANLRYPQLAEREQALSERVRQLLDEAARIDAEEDSLHGQGKRGDELPAELATAEKRLAKLRAAKQKMEREAREAAGQAEREREAAGGKPRNPAEKKRWYRAGKRLHSPEGQVNLSDADSRLMKSSGTSEYVQGYNAQAVVDEQCQIVVAADVVTEGHDRHQLEPMARQAEANLAAKPATLTADAGYWNEAAFAPATLQGIDVLVPPNSTEQRFHDRPLPANAPRSERAHKMRDRLSHAEGRALYAKRKAIVEPVFAHIKERRGFRRFSMRGLWKAQAEWSLICTTHNLIKLHRHRTAAKGG